MTAIRRALTALNERCVNASPSRSVALAMLRAAWRLLENETEISMVAMTR